MGVAFSRYTTSESSQPNFAAASSSSMPNRISGNASAAAVTACTPRSAHLCRRTAASNPIGNAASHAAAIDNPPSNSVLRRRGASSFEAGMPYAIETPNSPAAPTGTMPNSAGRNPCPARSAPAAPPPSGASSAGPAACHRRNLRERGPSTGSSASTPPPVSTPSPPVAALQETRIACTYLIPTHTTTRLVSLRNSLCCGNPSAADLYAFVDPYCLDWYYYNQSIVHYPSRLRQPPFLSLWRLFFSTSLPFSPSIRYGLLPFLTALFREQ